jgi:D-glycero-alpha-D-manno-heptose-7-phosphate kinase
MIIVQTPLRVSFFGGGTDFPSYYRQEGGCVLSTAIDKYIFVTIKERFDRKLRVGWTKTEMVDQVDEIHHELIRESLRKTGIREGIEITTMGDIPSDGSGLGSSATVTVGALHAMYSLKGELVSAEQLAQQACEIEIETLRKPSGVQDQYIAAYGGFRFMEFGIDGTIKSERIALTSEQRKKLNENTMLFFTGVTRRSDTVLTEQKQNIQDKLAVLKEMKHITYIAREEVMAGNIDAMGELLHESWMLKRQLASQISNSMLDEIYCVARKAGAIGGKISGAGGGGFLLLYCPYECQDSVRKALGGLQELQFKIEPDGSKVIFNYLRA